MNFPIKYDEHQYQAKSTHQLHPRFEDVIKLVNLLFIEQLWIRISVNYKLEHYREINPELLQLCDPALGSISKSEDHP